MLLEEKMNQRSSEDDFILNHIRSQIYKKNRNFTALIMGRVGTGKSFSALALCQLLHKDFNVREHVFFFTKDILKGVYEEKFPAGTPIIFDEAGIDNSNRKSYMDKFNIAMSFLLQTWRDRNIILFVTVPEQLFLDKGIRRLFDMHIETTNVNFSRETVSTKWKTVKVNYQSGKAYFTNLRDENGAILKIEIPKPDDEIIREYKLKKREFQNKLYKQQIEKIGETPIDEQENLEKREDKIKDIIELMKNQDFTKDKIIR